MQGSAVLILVVEDDAVAGGEVKRALEDAGFRVLLVQSGEKASSTFDENAGEVGGLVADVKLGGNVSGWDVARHAREVNQDLPVVYITGFSAEDWPSQGVPKSILVQKPFAPAQIITAISSLLNVSSTTLTAG
ncbi:MAG TPA: response regulator [Beijerinckiaceae bacterium]|jgi:DNA-binding response OmpR family regulator|nr:response regulator [Beijerinckiaceae bacterium]